MQVVSGLARLDGRRADGGLDGGGAGEVDESVGLGVSQGGGVRGVLLPELLPRDDDLGGGLEGHFVHHLALFRSPTGSRDNK